MKILKTIFLTLLFFIPLVMALLMYYFSGSVKEAMWVFLLLGGAEVILHICYDHLNKPVKEKHDKADIGNYQKAKDNNSFL